MLNKTVYSAWSGNSSRRPEVAYNIPDEYSISFPGM